ncbi:MAG: insulinase family protein, partial [Eubacterium sp.]
MKIHDKIHGFTLNREEIIEEVNGVARVFEHDQTRARLIYISNDDDNKVFQIGFKTPSKNSTGVAHILEHSVLCGSRKYPVKEPFVELAKGSMNTFLNAMTYPDKTVYPIASTNEKDFMNLMDVYMDAVFYPEIYNI